MKTLLFIALTILLSASAFAQLTGKDSVQQTFENYKTAILNDKAEDAIKAIDSRTLKYYTDILDVVKSADSNTIDSKSLIDKFTILAIRAKASREEILAMKGADLFIYAINNGMVGKNSVINNSVGEVTIMGTFAKGQLLVNKKPAPLYFHFYKELGNWKLDLTSLFPASNVAFKQMVDESGDAENIYIFNILEILNGKMPESSIWKPLI